MWLGVCNKIPHAEALICNKHYGRLKGMNSVIDFGNIFLFYKELTF